VFPLCITYRRIRAEATLTEQIPSKRPNLKLNLSLCSTTVTSPTMQPMQIDSASPPLYRGGEGSLDPEFQVEMTNTMMDLEMELLATGNNPCRDFNTAECELNTPDITDLDIGKILAETQSDIADYQTHNTGLETREDVWGHESFDIFRTMEYGLCLPATLVEGSQAAPVDQLIVPDTDPAALEESENIDLLRWIVEDQDIDPISTCEVAQSEQPAEVNRVSVIVPVSAPSASFFINPIQEEVKEEAEEKVKVKLENLSEDEKYRRMRAQNNDASKRCREKRKRKHQEMEEELEFLEKKNKTLKDKFESMEREVREMKRRLLSDISSK